ncbi:MAG: hypothetical protein IJ662_12065 [Clostridia bacterium]|nr:hypothetical protein [Clostridia bacterium]
MKKIICTMLIFLMLIGMTSVAVADAIAEYGSWSVYQSKDEFDLPIKDQYYVACVAYGNFSNTATSKGDLAVVMSVNQEPWVTFVLVEYGKHAVSNSSSKDYRKFDILMMDSDGNRQQLMGFMKPKSNRVIATTKGNYEPETNKAILKALMAGEGTVRFSVTDRDDSRYKYVFVIEDIAGFCEACEKANISLANVAGE